MFDIGKRGSGPQRDELDSELDRPTEYPGTPGSESQTPVRRRDAAVIGPSIHIEGTLRGEEDLLIEGRVKGTVQLQGHTLTIGAKGQVEAELHAQSIHVDGTVQGDLYGTDLVSIRKSARVFGNITAPRISLEDGARLKGSIDMDVEPARPAATSAGSSGAASGSSKPSSSSGGGATSTPASGQGDTTSTEKTAANDTKTSAASKGSATG